MKLLSLLNNLILKLSVHQLASNGAGPSSGKNDLVSNSQTTSSIQTFFNEIINTVLKFLRDFGETIYRVLAKVVYFVIKICLNIMDLFMVVINSLTGQATAFDLSKNTNLTETDILFRFLLNETTLKILRRVFYFSIFILIIVTIIAVIKNEWDKNANGKGMSHMQILKKVFMSLFWMFLTPFVLLVGILAANVILASGLNALQGKNKTAFSVGSTIFTASTYDANWYRQYADENKRIPILFDYNGGFYSSQNDENLTISTDGSSADTDAQIRAIISRESITSGQATYNMFNNRSYFDFNYITDNSYYYNIYDGQYLKPKRIEYYVMADFVDFAMESGAVFYVTNTEDVYESAINALKLSLKESGNIDIFITEEGDKGEYFDYFNLILNSITPYANVEDSEIRLVEFLEGIKDDDYDYVGYRNLTIDFIQNYDSSMVDNYKFNVYYNADVLPNIEKESDFNYIGETKEYYKTYSSLARAKDEADGAKYLFCSQEVIELENGEKQFILVPITQNTTINNYYNYESDYISSAGKDANDNLLRNESLFVAKGGFTGQGYPTAIRQDGDDVIFYRHIPGKPTLLSYLPTFSYTVDGSDKAISGANILDYITGVDISMLMPDIRIGLSAIATYTKEINNTNTLAGGKYVLNYSFVNSGLAFDNVYNSVKINYIVLFLACSTLMTTLWYIIFDLVKRIFELTVYWIMYPVFIAVNPLEKGDNFSFSTRFGKWRSNVIAKLFYVWGVYMGVAFFYLFIPIVMKFDITMDINLSETNVFSFLTPLMVSWIIKTIFILVLFGMLKELDRLLIDMITPGMKNFIDFQNGGTIQSNGAAVANSIKGGSSAAVKTYNPASIVKNTWNKLVDTGVHAVRMVPGSGIIADSAAGGAQAVRNSMLAGRTQRFVNATRSSTSDAAVTNATNDQEARNVRHGSQTSRSVTRRVADRIGHPERK